MSGEINESVLESLAKDGIVGARADQMAVARTREIMGSLAALHDPDMIAGGHDQIAKLGSRSVNSSIGSQWGKEGRVAEMDRAAQDALRRQGPDAKMNVTLSRCK